ncbi:MAG TPA: YfhO family protein [Pirellulales bacterium]|jgi:hypothetical protein|nr:YfhO family protein [Pirellulales bacterium]
MIQDSNTAVLDLEESNASGINYQTSQSSESLVSNRRSNFGRHATAIALIFAIAGLLTALGWPLLTGQIYTVDDLGWYHLPLRAFYVQQLARGQPFDWCPGMYCGFYLTGEGQLGSYHPLHWLLYKTLPLSVAFDLECWLSYPFMLAGMYLFLRRWNLRREAAGFGAMVFTFGSFNLLHLMHLNGLAIVAHLPWLLWAIDKMVRTQVIDNPNRQSVTQAAPNRRQGVAFCVIAGLTGSQLLLGYPQYVIFSLAVEVGYILLLAMTASKSSSAVMKDLLRWSLAVLLGALIGSVQFLPTIDALQHSVRQSSAAEGFATQGSMPLLNWMQLLTPYLFANRVIGGITHEFGMYMGAVPLTLAVWWLCRGKRANQHRTLTVAALTAAAIALLWTLGDLGPLGWLQNHVPLLNKFRLPSRAIVVFELAVAVLAALGFSTLLGIARNSSWPKSEPDLSNSGPSHRDRMQLLWALPLGSAAFTVLAMGCWRPYLSSYPLVAVGPVIMATAVCLVLRASAGGRWALAALILLSAIDLGVYGMSYSIYGHVEQLSQFIAKIDPPPGFPSGRVALDLANGTEAAPGQKTVRAGDQILLDGWQRVDGYAGLDPIKKLDYCQPAALRAAGAQWIAADAAKQLENANQHGWVAKLDRTKIVPDQPVFSMGKSTIWIRLRDPQPRAWLVSHTVASANPAVDISKISLTAEALVEKESSPQMTAHQPAASQSTNGPPAPKADPPQPVAVLADEPGNLLLEVKCPSEQFLIVNESYHGGWHATIDGAPAPILQADGDFMGTYVPAGHHEVALKFQPAGLRYSRLASGFGLSLLVVLFAISNRRTKRGNGRNLLQKPCNSTLNEIADRSK